MSLAVRSSNQTAVPTKTDSDSTSKKSSLNGRFYTYLGVSVGLVATAVALYYLSQSNASSGNGVLPVSDRYSFTTEDKRSYQRIDQALEQRFARELPCVAARLKLRGANTDSLQVSDLAATVDLNATYIRASSAWGKKNLEIVEQYNRDRFYESMYLLGGFRYIGLKRLQLERVVHPDNLLPQCVNIPSGAAKKFIIYFKELGVPDEIIRDYADLQTWAQGCNEQEMKSAVEEIDSANNPLLERGFNMSYLYQKLGTYRSQGKLHVSAPNVCLNLVQSRIGFDVQLPAEEKFPTSSLEEKHIVPVERFWNQLMNSANLDPMENPFNLFSISWRQMSDSLNSDPNPSFPSTKTSAEASGKSTWSLTGFGNSFFSTQK